MALIFRKAIIGALILMVGFPAAAQKQVQHLQQFWAAYFNQTRFSDRLGLWVDLHVRTKDDLVSDLSSTITRAGLTWHFNDQLRFTAGYAFVTHFPSQSDKGLVQPEHRPWQQLQWNYNRKKTRLVQTLRLEERYVKRMANENLLGDGYNFNYRVRYNSLLLIPFSRNEFAPKTLSGILNDEVMINFGKSIVNNYFDQNRFFVGIAYHVSAANNIQFGYSNVFQQLAAGNRYRNIQGVRLNYFHNVDLRKRKQ